MAQNHLKLTFPGFSMYLKKMGKYNEKTNAGIARNEDTERSLNKESEVQEVQEWGIKLPRFSFS